MIKNSRFETDTAKHKVVLVSSQEKQHLFKRLCHRNAIRRKLGLRPIDVPTVFRRKIRLMTEKRYDQLLQPFLAEAFSAADWPANPNARLLLASDLYRKAVDRLSNEQGVANPCSDAPNMQKVMDMCLLG